MNLLHSLCAPNTRWATSVKIAKLTKCVFIDCMIKNQQYFKKNSSLLLPLFFDVAWISFSKEFISAIFFLNLVHCAYLGKKAWHGSFHQKIEWLLFFKPITWCWLVKRPNKIRYWSTVSVGLVQSERNSCALDYFVWIFWNIIVESQ